jgi:hypothetical protein
MPLTAPKPLPPPAVYPPIQITANGYAVFTQPWSEYLLSHDTTVRSLAAGVVGPLINAANDAAAAAAGVPLQGLYRTANAVQIRLV